MLTTTQFVKNSATVKRQVIAVIITTLALLTLSLPAQAFEFGFNIQQSSEQETQGYAIYVGDNFSRRSPFYWSLGVSRYNEVLVDWNNSNLQFPINHAEAALSYRHQFTSRNAGMRKLSLEYQVGLAAALTENKFTWAELNEEKYFSEKGDANGFMAISAHYQVTKSFSANLGVKHFPKMSEFGSMSSVFLGIKFDLNVGPTYYGN